MTEKQKNNPWRKTFLNKEWNDANKITRRKDIHYEKGLEHNLKYINYFKTKNGKKTK